MNRTNSALAPNERPQPRMVEGSGEVLFATRNEKQEWYDSVVQRLNDLAKLNENWDSYGAAQVDVFSLHMAHAFLTHIRYLVAVPRPQVTATPDGRVTFSWLNDRRELDLEFEPTNTVSYYFEDRDCNEVVETETDSFKILFPLVTRF